MYSYDDVFVATKNYFAGQELQTDVVLNKYMLKDIDDNYTELTPNDLHDRLAREFAKIDESHYGASLEKFEALYRDAFANFGRIVPQGSPMSAIGNPFQTISASNCVVIENPEDSIDGIMKAATELAQLMKRRCGVGVDITSLRPNGMAVNNAARSTTGPCSFADLYSYITRLIAQCLHEDTRVLSKEGLVKIKDIQVGGSVWTKEGWVEVKNKIHNKKPCVKLTTKYGNTIICSEDHVFHTINGEKRVKELEKGDPITRIVGEGWVGKDIALSVSPYKKSTYNNSNRLKEITLPSHLDEKLSYVLGLMYGDGCVSNNEIAIAMAPDKPKIIEKTVSYIEDVFGYKVKPTSGNGCTRLRLSSKLIKHFLFCNKLLKQKSEHLRFPQQLFLAKPTVVFSFLSGYFDADGCVKHNKKSYQFDSISEDFLIDIKKILLAFGIPSNIHRYERKEENWKDIYNLTINGSKAQNRFRQLLTESIKVSDSKPFYKKRDFTNKDFDTNSSRHSYVVDNNQWLSYSTVDKLKGDIGSDKSTRLLQDFVESIETIEIEQNVYDLVLDREHLFFADGLYAHNSGRRGALMVTIDVHHPDVEEFARMKSDLGLVTGANVSIRLSDKFMAAVESDSEYEQFWPMSGPKKISRWASARKVWDTIIKYATETAEPGLIFWDTMTNYLPAHSYPEFRSTSTNPCSEICLSPNDSCRLISINLTGYVRNAFIEPSFDWELFKNDVALATRLSDNLVDIELGLIENIIDVCSSEQEKALWGKLWKAGHDGRRVGSGTHGLADMLAQLCIKYDSQEALDFCDSLYEILRNTAFWTSIELAKERGPYPVFDWNVIKDNPYVKRLPQEMRNAIQEHGIRNIGLLTQAPTGSVSLISKTGRFNRFGTSSGVEPIYQISHIRRKKVNPNDKNVRIDFVDNVGDSWQEYEVYHANVLNYIDAICDSENLTGKEREERGKELASNLPEYFVTSSEIDWQFRVKLQGVEQYYLDHSISSCLVAGTLINTSDGLVPIEKLVSGREEGKFYPIKNLKTINHLGNEVDVTEGFYNGFAECKKIWFGQQSIEGTLNHKLYILNSNYEFKWKTLGDIEVGDFVVSRIGLGCFGNSQKHISGVLGKFEKTCGDNYKKFKIPSRVDKELARLLGYLISDGHICENGIGLTQVKNNVIDDFVSLIKNLTDFECVVREDARQPGTFQVVVNSRMLRDYFKYLGIKTGASNKVIPDVIFECCGKQQTAEFIKGLTLDGYVSENKVCPMTTTSYKLAQQLMILLNQFGIDSNLSYSPKTTRTFPSGNAYDCKESWDVYCVGINAIKFIEKIGFSEKRKQTEAQEKFVRPMRRKVSGGNVPWFNFRDRARKEILQKIKSNELYSRVHSLSNSNRRDMDISRETLKIFGDLGMLIEDRLLDDSYLFKKVTDVKDTGVKETFDLHISDGNSYIANNIVSHNTINLPKGTSKETVGGIYLEAWKQGLKGVTVYVDGSRSGVLVTKDEKDDTIERHEAPKRPKQLPCDIHRTRVKGEEWVVFVGLFDDRLYEIFGGPSNLISIPRRHKHGILVKKAKGKYGVIVDGELVTKDVAGLFDQPELSWATRLISTALRHGTPLEFLTEQLNKVGNINDFNKAIARVLKRYIKDGEKVRSSVKCPSCGDTNFIWQEGCPLCASCGYTKC